MCIFGACGLYVVTWSSIRQKPKLGVSNTGVGKSRSAVVRTEKDMQVIIITVALLITTIIIIQIRRHNEQYSNK